MSLESIPSLCLEISTCIETVKQNIQGSPLPISEVRGYIVKGTEPAKKIVLLLNEIVRTHSVPNRIQLLSSLTCLVQSVEGVIEGLRKGTPQIAAEVAKLQKALVLIETSSKYLMEPHSLAGSQNKEKEQFNLSNSELDISFSDNLEKSSEQQQIAQTELPVNVDLEVTGKK